MHHRIKRHSTETIMLSVLSGMHWQQLTDSKWRWSDYLTCQQHSTASIKCYCYSDYTTSVVCQAQCCGGWRRSCPAGRNRLCIRAIVASRATTARHSAGVGSRPMWFVLYTAELHRVVESHGLTLHQYADDCQTYTATPINLASSVVAQFTRCLADVGDWMTASRQWLNPAKTQVLWLGSKFQIERVDIRQVPVLSSAVHIVNTARDLGVTMDSRLTMADQVTATCSWSPGWSSSPSSNAAKVVVQAFIMCRLDYCNSLLFGIADDQLQQLQAIQNATLHLVSGARRSDHITPLVL